MVNPNIVQALSIQQPRHNCRADLNLQEHSCQMELQLLLCNKSILIMRFNRSVQRSR